MILHLLLSTANVAVLSQKLETRIEQVREIVWPRAFKFKKNNDATYSRFG